MIEEKKKSKSPLWWLLGFPIVDVLSVLIFILGVFIDSKIYENATGQGHPAPIFSLLLFIVAAALFVIGNLLVLIMLIVSSVISKKRKKNT